MILDIANNESHIRDLAHYCILGDKISCKQDRLDGMSML